MSRGARRLSRKERAACGCGHRAVFAIRRARGFAVRARRDHTLCPRCWRAACARAKASQMATARARRLHFVPGPFAVL
jgi:hypothetical protein